jgi:hypothetical protein
MPNASVMNVVPNNSDATFKKHSKKPKPSDLLLHYNYGAAAVKCWGHGEALLQTLCQPPRPPVPVPAPTGPSRTIRDRGAVIRKLDKARNGRGAGAGSSRAGPRGSRRRGRGGAGTGELVESTWDEDDVMLFFWGNSRAATERHLKKVSENTRRMEQWRTQVSV